MVGRRPRRNAAKREYRELDFSTIRAALPHSEIKRGVEFQVQQSTGANAEEGKRWKCPVCQIDIEQGLGHTVAWDLHRGVETRRHFHNHCWKLFDGMLT